jgi:anti-anti-sigma factor
MSQWRNLEIQEGFEDDGYVRLTLIGELDMASVEALGARLNALRQDGYHVRIDLTELAFMDSTGLGQLVDSMVASRRNGWRLEVCRELSQPVDRLIELSGTGGLFWPEG